MSVGSYSFVDNNNCYVPNVSYSWEATYGSLASWRTHSGNTFDMNSITTNPLFKNAPTDFTPLLGSPLIGAGNNTNKSTLDILGKNRPNPPAIGAFEP